MLHRGNLMSRIRLPPTSPNFPHPSLLHAICATASQHTAWVNSLPPEALEAAVVRNHLLGIDFENLEDFGLAQAESSGRSMRHALMTCSMGPGSMLFEMIQAEVWGSFSLRHFPYRTRFDDGIAIIVRFIHDKRATIARIHALRTAQSNVERSRHESQTRAEAA